MVLFENIWWLLVLIGAMIIIHELGHYWAARYFDVHVEAFSFGFGPRLFGFKKGETDFRFSLILFGGYVKMLGEQPGEDNADDPRSFLAEPRWQRLIIAFAGPFMIVVLAVALLTGLFMFKYPQEPSDAVSGMIGHVAADSPAGEAGIQAGDRIVAIDGQAEPPWDDILLKEFSSSDRPVSVTIDRNGQRIPVTITPVLDDKTGVGYAGWSEEREIQISGILEGGDAQRAGLQPGDTILSVGGQPIRSTATIHEVMKANGGNPVKLVYSRDGVRDQVTLQPKLTDIDGEERYMIGVQLRVKMVYTSLPIGEAFQQSVEHNVRSATLILQFLKGLVEQRMSAKSLEGPIRIAQLSGDAAREGAFAFIGLMAMVSLNLAVFNLLPIPILDGGVILMLLVEMAMGRDLSMAVKEGVLKVGFLFLMVLVVFVIYNDLQKVLPSGG